MQGAVYTVSTLLPRKGLPACPFVEDILIDVFYYFQKSVNRQTELKDSQDLYNTEQRKVLKHVCTRWLSIGRFVSRLVFKMVNKMIDLLPAYLYGLWWHSAVTSLFKFLLTLIVKIQKYILFIVVRICL